MKSRIIFVLILTFSYNVKIFSQKKLKAKHYVKISSYKKIKKLKTVNLDTLEHIIYKGDTLIAYKRKPDSNKIQVPFDYRDSSFLKYYTPIAFRLSSKTKDSLKVSMKYWRNDIKLFFSKNISRKLKKEFISFVDLIDKEIDSLNISSVKKIEESNFIIYTSNEYNYESRLVNSKESSYFVYWDKNKIYKGAIKLDDEVLFNDKLKLYELKKQFLKSLGHFRFDERLDCRHLFSDCYSPKKELSKLDLEFLKYHYSYGICKGINLETFLDFHKKAREIKEKGGKLMITHLKSDLAKK